MSKKKKMTSRIQLTKSGTLALFRKVHHVIRARAQEGGFSQYNLQYILVEEKNIIATNGHVLCIAEIDEGIWMPGYYLVVKDTKAKLDLIRLVDDGGLEFPDYKKITGTDYEKIITKTVHLIGSDSISGVSTDYSRIVRNIPEGYSINMKFVEMLNDLCFVVIPQDDNAHSAAILFKDEGIKAFVMPMKM